MDSGFTPDARMLLTALLRLEACSNIACDELKAVLNKQMLSEIFLIAQEHDLAHIVGNALSKLELLGEDEVSGKFKQVSMQAVRRYVQMSHDFGLLCGAFENAHIPFIPLKGIVIRNYYPEPWMRTSCDIDILVHEEDLERAIQVMETDLGYRNEGRGYHDISLFSPNNVHMELHFTLSDDPQLPAAQEMIAGIWDQVFPVQIAGMQMQMPDELYYFYHILHMAHHFCGGGCGIRPFLDLWILEHKMEHDPQKRETLLKKGSLLTFSQAAHSLCEVWFSGQPHTELTQKMENYIFRGGAYGNAENMAAAQQAKKGGKVKVILQKIFLPYSRLKGHYPILQKHKWLLPFCQVARWFRLFSSDRRKRSIHVLKAQMAVSKGASVSAEQLLTELGL